VTVAFIDAHRNAYGIEPTCKLLRVAPSTYRIHEGGRGFPRGFRGHQTRY